MHATTARERARNSISIFLHFRRKFYRVTTGYDVFMRSYYKITHKPIYMTEYGVSSSVSTRSLKVSSAGPVHNWMGDRLAIPGAVYTRTCVQRCRVVRLREPRKSDCSSDWPRVRRKRTWMDVGAVSIRRDPRKSTMCEYLAHKAIHSFIHSFIQNEFIVCQKHYNYI